MVSRQGPAEQILLSFRPVNPVQLDERGLSWFHSRCPTTRERIIQANIINKRNIQPNFCVQFGEKGK